VKRSFDMVMLTSDLASMITGARARGLMCLLLFSEVRVIVVNPQTPTWTVVNTDLIAQHSQPGIFHGSHRVEMLKSLP